MPCCGERRAALRAAHSRLSLSAPGSPPAATPEPPAGDVSVAYLADGAIRVRGSVSERTYAFSGAGPVQSVDPRDAAALLRTGFFRLA